MKKEKKFSLYIIIAAAVLLQLISGVQYWYAHRVIRRQVEDRANSEMNIKRLAIEKKLVVVETAVENMAWAVEAKLSEPEEMFDLALRTVKQNEHITGCAILFSPNYYPSKGYWFEPYAVRRADGSYETMQLGSADHDYTQMQLYRGSMEGDSTLWTEPYLDKDGARMMLTSYTCPIHDSKGNTVAVLAADVSLDWLNNVINATHLYPSSFNLMLSKMGQIMVCPTESLVMKKTIHNLAERMNDTTLRTINSNMLSGKDGSGRFVDNSGTDKYVFYSPIGCGTGWSMAVICVEKEIYHNLRSLGANLLMLMFLGLMLIAFIIKRMIHNMRHLHEVSLEKERIGNELHIASSIQSGMVPKVFPPYPERDDIEIFASLVSAREVGGDLYDFYIRDEKLFFCIGDVSGKGIPASLLMAVTRSLFRTVSAHESKPSAIVSQMNEAMADMNDSNMFVTLFVGELNLLTGRMRYCNAGHCPPLIVNPDVNTLPVDANIPVGLVPDWTFTTQETLINPQTTIFLYTDGLTEAEDASHVLYGEERMKATAREAVADGRTSPESLFNQMTQSVEAFVDKAVQSDDLTMLVIQYKRSERNFRLQRSLTLPNDTQTIPQLHEFVTEIASSLAIDEALAMQLDLALEEAVVNPMTYAYPPGTQGVIDILAMADDSKVAFVIKDSGIPFDPTTKDDVDTTLSADERPIGGLGIFLVRQIMDSINYERVGKQNVLTLIKKFNTEPAE